MATNEETNEGMKEGGREPFIAGADRPEVRIDPDRPITELRVRDLTSILGQVVIKKYELKEPIKEFIKEKFEHKEWKLEIKEWKPEKFEKNEKVEIDFAQKRFPDNIPDPTGGLGPDPRLDQVIQVVTGLQTQVSQLANQVAELQRKMGG